ncbi:probable periplasmic protein Cj0057 [Campylobacter upsaliensis RM3195]|nr:probable periplasmic protein Cj0057 [Campylobacter upsaliensis RM3195]
MERYKASFLTQTFIYTLHPKFDLLISGGGSYARQEYTNFFTNAYFHKDRIGFDNLWLGKVRLIRSISKF